MDPFPTTIRRCFGAPVLLTITSHLGSGVSEHHLFRGGPSLELLKPIGGDVDPSSSFRSELSFSFSSSSSPSTPQISRQGPDGKPKAKSSSQAKAEIAIISVFGFVFSVASSRGEDGVLRLTVGHKLLAHQVPDTVEEHVDGFQR